MAQAWLRPAGSQRNPSLASYPRLRFFSLTYDLFRINLRRMASSAGTPTRSEVAILRTLWTHGPSTVREVHKAVNPNREVGYTTTLKMLQLMTAKGLTIRETRGQQHLYRARHPERQMQRRLLRDFLDRVYGGATGQLVVQALTTKRATADELREIRRLLAAVDDSKGEGQ